MLKPQRDFQFIFRSALTGREEPAAGGAGDETTPDLQHPAVQKAIEAAVSQVRTKYEEDTQGLKAKRDQLLDEVKTFKSLGNAEDLERRLAKLEELETAAQAAGAGSDPDKFKSAVEAAAQEKYKARAAELDGVVKQKSDRVTELEQQLEEVQQAEHRAFVASQLLMAAMPEDTQIVHPGAWDHLIDNLARVTVPKDVDGMKVARIKAGDTFVPGNGPDQLMTFAELLPLARQGKGPLPNLGYCFVSAGTGSGTKEAKGGSPGGSNWWKMSEEQRTAYIAEHGQDAAIDLAESSTPPS